MTPPPPQRYTELLLLTTDSRGWGAVQERRTQRCFSTEFILSFGSCISDGDATINDNITSETRQLNE